MITLSKKHAKTTEQRNGMFMDALGTPIHLGDTVVIRNRTGSFMRMGIVSAFTELQVGFVSYVDPTDKLRYNMWWFPKDEILVLVSTKYGPIDFSRFKDAFALGKTAVQNLQDCRRNPLDFLNQI